MPYFLVIAFLLVIFSKGGLRVLLRNLRFKYPYLLLIPLVIQVFLTLAAIPRTPFITIVYILSFLCVMIGLILNHRLPGFKLITFGVSLNLLVILLNHGSMAVFSGTIQFLTGHGFPASSIRAHAVSQSVWYWWLADWIPVPFYLMSPGDILVGLGIIRLVLRSTKT